MHTMIPILGVHSSGISVQDTVGLKVISFSIRVFLVVVDVVLLFIPHADSLLLISDGSSSASAATNVLVLRQSVSQNEHLAMATVKHRIQECAGEV